MIAFTACSKKSSDTTIPSTTTEEKKPVINSVTFSPASAGGNESIRFTVKLTADSSLVSKVTLNGKANGTIRWEVLKPTTGTYTMYDHLGDYPTYATQAFYYFTFHMKSGAKITTEPFQVY